MASPRRAVGILLLMTLASVGSGVTTSAGASTAPAVAGTASARSHASLMPLNPAEALAAAVRPDAASPVGLSQVVVEPVDSTTTAGKGFTYWGFYKWDDKTSSWPYSKVGANDRKSLPEDGDVYGFRWATIIGTDQRPPRADGDFDAICGGEEAGEAEKRIAFVLDYGTQADAAEGEAPPDPRGVCATFEEDFTVQQALQTVAKVRTDDSGLICGIDDYPSTGCGGAVSGVSAPPADEQVTLDLPGDDATETGGSTSGQDAAGSTDAGTTDNSSADDGSTSTVTIVLAVVAILAMAVAGLVVSRRRR